MQPQSQSDNRRADGFKPKWRHFHPMDRVWVNNPFDHDVMYQVADEYNRPYKYVLPAHKVSELPGGAIATLGVKAIVDELIQNTPSDEMRMWDENVRKKHEDSIIMREKQIVPMDDPTRPGIVDLSVKTADVPEAATEAPKAPEEAFPGLRKSPTFDPLPAAVDAGIADVVSASLPRSNAIVGANNVHNDESQMANPFTDATILVGDLESKYAQLTKDVPKLKEVKKGLVEDVDQLNKTLIATQDKLEATNEQIVARTDAYNTWQRAELKKLDTARAVLVAKERDTEDEQTKRAIVLGELKATTDKDRLDNVATKQALVKDQEDIDAQTKVNNEWAARLGTESTKLDSRTRELDAKDMSLTSKLLALDNREKRVAKDEGFVKETSKAAEEDRHLARQLLANAKDKIAEMDARDNTLKLRAQELSNKKLNLDRIEVALNDRRDVMISNGTLQQQCYNLRYSSHGPQSV